MKKDKETTLRKEITKTELINNILSFYKQQEGISHIKSEITINLSIEVRGNPIGWGLNVTLAPKKRIN